MKKFFYLAILILMLTNISALEYHYNIQITNNNSNFSIDKINVDVGKVEEEIFGGNYF